jgi:hypothetical protein
LQSSGATPTKTKILSLGFYKFVHTAFLNRPWEKKDLLLWILCVIVIINNTSYINCGAIMMFISFSVHKEVTVTPSSLIIAKITCTFFLIYVHYLTLKKTHFTWKNSSAYGGFGPWTSTRALFWTHYGIQGSPQTPAGLETNVPVCPSVRDW